jgi:hypothetical protein
MVSALPIFFFLKIRADDRLSTPLKNKKTKNQTQTRRCGLKGPPTQLGFSLQLPKRVEP